MGEPKISFDCLPVPDSLRKIGRRLIIRTEQELDWVCQQIENAAVHPLVKDLLDSKFNGQYKRMLSFDTEGEDYGYPRTKCVGLSLSWNGEDGCYIPFGHDTGNQLPVELVMQKLKPYLEDTSTLVIMHNA